jgi:integrase
MASVIKREDTWYARWKDGAGRRRSGKTACTTRKDAQRFADDLERKAERQRHGLEPLHEEAPPMTFGELFSWWLREYAVHQRSDSESFYRKRLLPTLEKLPLQDVTSAKLEGMLQSHTKELSPKSLNELRSLVHTLFKRATQRGLWHGLNPAAGVEKRKVDRKLFDTLRAEEVPLILAALKPHWRPVFATAVWTGLRQGELLGLRKSDVDMVAGTIAVRRSYDADTTKGGHADLIPIAAGLRPYLAEAMLSARGEYVFPDGEGHMRSRQTKLRTLLARALKRAGLVTGYLHVCRRKGCEHREEAKDRAARRCPKCNMTLWPKALPRKMRFHDLRGTTATLLARAGVGLVVAQRILRHSDPRLTANIYSRVDLGDLQAGIDRMGIPAAAAPAQ